MFRLRTHQILHMQSDLESMGSRMPGCHQGGLALFMLMVKAEKGV